MHQDCSHSTQAESACDNATMDDARHTMRSVTVLAPDGHDCLDFMTLLTCMQQSLAQNAQHDCS